MAARTIQEIEKINRYVKEWKIKTNNNKYKIISTAVKKKNNIMIDGEIKEYSGCGTILGTTFSNNGINKHAHEMATK